jgi:photosystem II stability/assembly factor-like uncharacterized protein
MRFPKPALHVPLLFVFILLFGAVSRAQERPKSPSNETPITKPQLPVAKKQVIPPTSTDALADLEEVSGTELDKDSAEQIRKRDEWFYKQRSSVNGRIPAGARFKAFQHMQRMMIAEGKLVLRPDGSYAEVAPQSRFSPFGAVTSAWASIGPTPTTGGFFSPVTGRITTIAVDPSDSTGNTVLIGGAMGGIWRSTDAGATWTAVGDQNASLAMGSIAFAPSNHSIVYAGTGEQASIGFDIYYGAGVLRSADSGQHWTQTCTVAGPGCPFIGPYSDVTPFGYFTLGGTRISYISVNPSNPQMVLVAAQTQFAEGTTEGVYCSDNGGASWSNILPDEMSTFVGFASSTVAYAAFGNPFGSSPNAPNGNGIYKATGISGTCASVNFVRLTASSLPLQSTMGRIDLGIAPSDSTGNTVYASISASSTASETNLGVFVTTNGGTSWTQTFAPDVCQHQCWYDNVIKVDPNNKNIAFFGGAAVRDSSGNYSWVVRTENGGTSWSSVIPNLPAGSSGLPHVDNHAIAFVKLSNGKIRMYLGNDGGIWRTDDAETTPVTWINLNNPSLTLTQFYPSISINPSTPSIAFGGTQDNGSQNYQGGTSWVDNQLCGDGASTAVDAIVPSTVYIGCATGAPINVSYQSGAIGTFYPAINGINLSDSAGFIPPLAADPNSSDVLYFGTTKVYQSVDAGNTWTALSSDLVDPSQFYLNVIAVAPGNSKVVYAGASYGPVFVSSNVSAGSGTFVGVPNQAGGGTLPIRTVTAIAVDPVDPSGMTAYVAYSGFSDINFNVTPRIYDPNGHIFKTTDGGATWLDASCSVQSATTWCATPAPTDLPNIPVNDIVLDPDVPGTIYAATDIGVFIGNCSAMPCTWATLGTGLPRAAVFSLRLHEASRTLRAATHGRGAWDIFLNNFSFNGPRIFSISPISVPVGASNSLTITVDGSGLSGGAVQWNGSVTSVTTTQVSATQLTASVAASLLAVGGTQQITVLNAGQTSNALTFSVLATTPTLTSLNPSSTPVQMPNPTTNVPIQLTGANFSSTAKVLYNGAQNGITTKFNSTTSLTATLPAALLGPYGSINDIAVVNTPPGGGKSQSLSFKVTAPPPPNDNFANATNITALVFSDTQDTSGATTEPADPLPPCASQYSSANGNTGGHPNGLYNTIWYKFTPIFSANLEIDTIGSNYDTVLSIWTGTGTSETTLTATNVACNDNIQQGVIIQSQLSSIPLTANTTYYIMVSSFGPPDPNPIALGGKSQFNFSYNFGNYPSPVLTSILPTSASSGDPAFTLTINGSSFFNGSILNFDDTATSLGAAVPTTYVSPTQITAVIPASLIALPGPFTVLVLSPPPSYAPSNSLNFTVNLGVYPVPTITSIYPTTIIAGSLPFMMIVNGANFAPAAVLNFNGVAKSTTLDSSQSLFATISTADISTAGTVQVTVSNPKPGGGPSAPVPFIIAQPTVVPNITSVSPPTVPAGIPTNFTINGTGFTQGANLQVVGTGGGYYNTNFVSSTQLTIPTFAVGGVGTYPIYVVDPAPAGTSTAFSLAVTQPPPPTITSISPPTAPTGSSPTLTITGTNFQPGASVMFNGGSFGANFTSSTQLTVFISLGGVAAGTYPLSVVNPIPSATASAPVNFTVTLPPPPTITSISPATAQTGSSPTLTIIGTNFQPGTSVMFNGGSFGANFTSSTQLTATISLVGVIAGTYPLSVVNPVPPGTTSAPVNFTVTGPPDFSVTSSGTTTQTVNAGQTATFTNALTIAAGNGFNAQVNLICSLPVAVTATTTCSVTPNSFPTGSGTASVMVTTMARGLMPPSWPHLRIIFRPQFLLIFLLTVLLSVFLMRLARTPRQRFAGAIPLAGLLLFLTLQAIGCGGGSSQPPPPPPPTGTPAGNYTVTVTATSGTLTHTATLTLVVQ